MKICLFCLLPLFLLLTSTFGEDAGVEDVDGHPLERLAELLSDKECEEFLVALSESEENIFQHLQHLSPEENQLNLTARVKRDLSAESETECRANLTEWLRSHGEETFYDRLTRALQHIGRTDVASEVGKNMNQDMALNLKHYVEDYHKYVESLKAPALETDTKNRRAAHKRIRIKNIGDLSWRDMDLIVERAPVPPYEKGPRDVLCLLLFGVLLSFCSTLTAGVFVLLLVFLVSGVRRWRRRSQAVR